MSLCSTCKTGKEPYCFNRTLCETTLACNNYLGCLYYTNITEILGEIPYFWTPLGTLDPLVSPFACNPGITPSTIRWEGPLTTVEECSNWGYLCNDGTVVNASTDGAAFIPTGFNWRNETECIKCGGTYNPFWKWTPGTWVDLLVPSHNLSWRTPEEDVVQPTWRPRLFKKIWTDLLDKARALRLATLFIGELLCNFGVEKEVLYTISCSCSAETGEICFDSLISLGGSSIAFISACEGIPSIVTVEEVTINITPDFSISSNTTFCESIEIGLVPLTQFQYRAIRVLTSLAIYSETSQCRANATYIYNHQEPSTVIGELISDGYFFNYKDDYSLSGLIMCYNLSLSSPDWHLRSEINTFDLVSTVYPFKEFTLLHLDLPLNSTRACIELKGGDNLTYFVVGLVKDWETLRISDTWLSEELGLIIFLAVSYFCLLFWATFSFVGRLLAVTQGFYIQIGLAMIILQSTLRVIYFIGVPFGTFEFENLALLFSDLPQLLFHSVVVLTGITWSEIVVRVEKRGTGVTVDNIIILSYIYIISLTTFFVALAITYGCLSGEATTEFTCASTQAEKDQITSAEAVLLVYKALFAFYSVMIAVTFALQAQRVIALLFTYRHANQKSKEKNLQKMISSFLITSIFSISGLLIQAAIAIYSAVSTMSTLTKLILIVCCELIPTYVLAYLFRYGSIHTKAKKWGSSIQSRSRHSKADKSSKGSKS
eukprot:TRINITY_DN19601_c0_g1_i1.p1 TRINITY_DN19601_c0_g1~~TRINITY_DN19601_c0_g1_i1.p1  ORF type:complete len:825 (-),score=89.79 TRINITY_DN19601_c0_g1_i1:69-2210(-)